MPTHPDRASLPRRTPLMDQGGEHAERQGHQVARRAWVVSDGWNVDMFSQAVFASVDFVNDFAACPFLYLFIMLSPSGLLLAPWSRLRFVFSKKCVTYDSCAHLNINAGGIPKRSVGPSMRIEAESCLEKQRETCEGRGPEWRATFWLRFGGWPRRCGS